jgi:hypothetical protein
VALVLLRDRHDQAEVRVDHQLLRLAIAALDALRELDLLGRRQQPVTPRLVQEELQRIRGCRGKLTVDVGLLCGFGTCTVVRQCDVALFELLVEALHLLFVELGLLEELADRRQIQAAVFLALLEQCM